MPALKADIITQLQRDILSLQGFKSLSNDSIVRPRLGAIDLAFPNYQFPLASVHEFLNEREEQVAASSAFIACLLSSLMNNGRAAVWISPKQNIFPPALKLFGAEPDKIIFIHVKKEQESLWVMEEALKCEGLAAVIAEIAEINFTASRRLQLAVEQSRVTGFIIRNHPLKTHSNACTARWKISSWPSENNLPGIGFPRWSIELLKIKNGKPGSWQMEWRNGTFNPVTLSSTREAKRKVV